jgi:recombination protein RecR
LTVIPDRLRRLIDHLGKLPGVGEKTATRFALYLVTADPALVRAMGEELSTLHDAVRPCSRCGYLAEVISSDDPPVCSICRDGRRDPSVLCVVARVQDLMAIERSGAMRGRYFVLAKLLSPLDGIGPSDLPLDKLATRIAEDGVREVIVATPPTVDGEATALLLARELRASGARVSRIASGVPHGGDLEFADQITLGRALEGRQSIE